MDEDQLIEKLRLVEALHEGAATAGERDAAARARDRLASRLKTTRPEDPPVEYKFRLADLWSRRLFLALLRRHGITPYRYSGQRRTTVMARVPKSLVNDVLWPEFVELDNLLRTYLDDVTDRIIREGLQTDSSEAEERPSLPHP